MDITNLQFTSIFNSATAQNRSINALHYFDMAICAVIFAIVTGVLIYCVIRFRGKEGDPIPKQIHGNVKLEIFWTVVPLIIVSVLGVLTAIVMHMNAPPVAAQPDVIVNAHQYWWEFRYPKLNVVTANELVLPLGVNTLFEVTSADVAHSFWVPNFGPKMDAIPGRLNYIVHKPIQQGVFAGMCTEFCGNQHSLMRVVATVVPPDKFQEWVASQRKVPSTSGDSHVMNGKALFMTQTCAQCHAIAGTSATANVAPDLTHIATRMGIGAGVLPNNTENLTQWIMNPQQFKPGCNMPAMRLTHDEARDIALYLESLK